MRCRRLLTMRKRHAKAVLQVYLLPLVGSCARTLRSLYEMRIAAHSTMLVYKSKFERKRHVMKHTLLDTQASAPTRGMMWRRFPPACPTSASRCGGIQ